MKLRRWGALAAIFVLVAGCGGPTPSQSGASATPVNTASTMSPSAATPTSRSSPSPSESSGCQLSDPVTLALPAQLSNLDGTISGVTEQGELLVAQSHLPHITDTLSVLNPRTGAIELVVSRPPAASVDAAASQIGEVSGNADWIVWEEVGFYLEHADWTLWAKDRHSGTIRKVASFEPGTGGQAAPGFISHISLLGDLAAWSAPIEVPGSKVEPRIYVADLRARTVRMLEPMAQWPSLISTHELAAAVVVAYDADGKALAQPATITLPDGKVTVQDWVAPARLLAHAASASGTVVVRMVKAPTAEDPVTVAEIVARDASGTARTFALPQDWGDVAAGPGFLAWLDQRHVWALLSGQADAMVLTETPSVDLGIRIVAAGRFLFWQTGGEPVSQPVYKMAEAACG